MKNLKLFFFLSLTFFIHSCSDRKVSSGLTQFKNVSSISDFASELWIEGNTFKGSFSDDYNTFYFFRKVAPEIEEYIPYKSNFINGKWEAPKIMGFYDKKNSYSYQLNIPNNNKLIFISNKRTKKDTTQNPNYNFWEIELTDNKNTNPKELGYENLIYSYNSQPCITNNGTIFFTSDLPDWSKTLSYKMECKGDKYLEPELFEPVNHWRKIKDWTVYEFCMSPDEDYIIACIGSKNGSVNSIDLYISYLEGEKWTIPKRLNDKINSNKTENFPTITNDGKYLMFTREFSEFKIIPTKLFVEKK
ncbi:hypothetical protein [Kriegella aquimaris]|nr:hypothetical protein [Kriegella aquimaris]